MNAAPAPRAAPLFATFVLGSLAGAVLVAAFPRLPPDPGAVAAWWDEVGSAAAALTVVHLVALGLAGWLMITTGIGLAAAIRPSATSRRLWQLVSTSTLRRIAGGGLVLAASAASVPPAAGDDTPTLVDLGPAPDDPVVLVDLGPVHPIEVASDPTPELAAVVPDGGELAAETWTVERGDHLWRIAEETLQDRNLPIPEADVTRYWRRLIEANRDVVGDDPDLIHPGELIRLPD